MKVLFERDDLLSAIKAVRGFVPDTHFIPVLQHVLLETNETEPDIAMLSVSNGTASIRHGVKCSVIAIGSATIPAKRLYNAVTAFSDGEIMIESDINHSTIISNKSTKIKLGGFSPDEFPPISSSPSSDEAFSVSGKTFLQMISNALTTAKTGGMRIFDLGICLMTKSGRIMSYGTDGCNVVFSKTSDGDAPKDVMFVVPRKIAEQITNSFRDGENITCFVEHDQESSTVRQVFFRQGNTVVGARLRKTVER